MKDIQISETTSPADAPALPDWLMVKKSFTSSSSPPPATRRPEDSPHLSVVKDDDESVVDGSREVMSRIELIGIPSNRDRKAHFFHVKLVNRKYCLIDGWERVRNGTGFSVCPPCLSVCFQSLARDKRKRSVTTSACESGLGIKESVRRLAPPKAGKESAERMGGEVDEGVCVPASYPSA